MIGNRFCTVITGPEDPGQPRGVQRRRVIDGLSAAAELLEPTDLTIVVEPLGMEHGLSVPGRAGLMKCFEEYAKADAF